MTVNFRSENAVALVKPETTAGTDAAPTASANAIRVQPPQYSLNFDNEQTNFARESVSASQPIIGGGMAAAKLSSFLMGSATAGTTAPDICSILRGCAMAQTLTSADVAGTATAGATGSITLAAGASAVDNAYRGMVIETTGGTGTGQRRVISGYVGSTKVASVVPNWTVTPDATTVYAIRKSCLMTPITVAQESLTAYLYQRNSASGGVARLRKLVGAMGNYSIGVTPKKVATLDFTLQGQLPAAPTDVSDPGAATFAGVDPLPYLTAQSYLGQVPIKFNAFSFDSGNKLSNFADPSKTYGNDTCEVVDRTSTGKITPALSLVATMDAVSDWLGSVSKPLWLCWGPVGQGVSIFLPAIRYTGNQPTSVDGFESEDLPFQATGDDLEILLNLF